MEFLRFGSSIPGSYWGCCAVCIIQDFNQDPDQKSSIQIVSGDGGGGLTTHGGLAFAGPTYGDIFKTRMRIGTFSTKDMPDHAFFAILTEYQVNNYIGKKWLALLKAEGFEFIRAQSNSVYTGNTVPDVGAPNAGGSHPNYIFGLFRNIQVSRVPDPFKPPQSWTNLPSVVPEAWEAIPEAERAAVAQAQTDFGRSHWAATGPTKLLTEKNLVEAEAPVILAGLRSKYPPQEKSAREQQLALENGKKASIDPFAAKLQAAAPATAKVKVKS